MILINRTNEPPCLAVLRNEENSSYEESLQGDCKKQVTTQLDSDQKHLCAYCQRAFTSTVFIEHYIPQSIDASKQLDYSNFLGVCSGKYYVNRKTGKAIMFCSVNRANHSLRLDPSNLNHVDTIYYDENFRICSSNRQFEEELNRILNLNFDELCLDRIDKFERTLKSYQDLGLKMKLSPVQIYTKALQIIKNKNPDFSGFLLYKYQKLLHFHKKKE